MQKPHFTRRVESFFFLHLCTRVIFVLFMHVIKAKFRLWKKCQPNVFWILTGIKLKTSSFCQCGSRLLLTSQLSLCVIVSLFAYLLSGFMFALNLQLPAMYNSFVICLHLITPDTMVVDVAPCRLPVCARGEGWKPGHHFDSDLGS